MQELLDEQSRIEAAQRDPALFADLYERNFDRVYAYVSRRVRDRATTEDVTSEVFRHALRSLPTFEWQGVPFIAWLLRIASRQLAAHYQHSNRHLPALPEPAPADIETAALLAQLVDRLPEAQYRVIYMRFVEQKSVREIADALERSEGAIKQLQFRALETLRAQLGGNE